MSNTNTTSEQPEGQTTDLEKNVDVQFASVPCGKRFTIKTPDGEIAEYGICLTKSYLKLQGLPPLPEDFEWIWVTRRGTLPKRVQSFYHKQHAVRLTPEQVSELGNVARAHCGSASKEYTLDFTNRITWEAGEFGDYGSCYWGNNAQAKDMLHENGAFAVRGWKSKKPDDDQSFDGYARAWLVPIGQNRLVVFNGYGETSLTFARLLALKFSCSYKAISLRNNGSDGGMLYINTGCYVVGAWEQIQGFEKHDFGWDEPEEDTTIECAECECVIEADDAIRASGPTGYRVSVCGDCANFCNGCEDYYVAETTYDEQNDQSYCEACLNQIQADRAQAERDEQNELALEGEAA